MLLNIHKNHISNNAGIVKIIFIKFELASGNALLIFPSAGDTAAPAITVIIEIDSIADLSKIFIVSLLLIFGKYDVFATIYIFLYTH